MEALAGSEPTVLGLACGTGSISDRVLRRFPRARSTGVGLDPALLTNARGHFAGDERIGFVEADPHDPGRTGRLPHERYDAVLTATALPRFHPEPLEALYGRVSGVCGREGCS